MIDAPLVMFVLVASRVLATTVPPTGVTVTLVGATGACVSITMAAFVAREPAVPAASAGRVKVALLPRESAITPPLRARAEVDCWERSALLSPDCTV